MKSNGNKNCFAHTFANMEQSSWNEPVAKKKNKGYAAPCSIIIHSIRRRLADPDGICGKAVIDGIVHCGILQDDSSSYVKEVLFSQEKTSGKEKTIITIKFEE